MATFDNHLPSSPIVSFFKRHPVIFPQVVKAQLSQQQKQSLQMAPPLQLTVVSDKVQNIIIFHKSAQKTELEEIIIALQTFPEEPLNIYTDSLYIAQLVP